jgi:hypothetical protein
MVMAIAVVITTNMRADADWSDVNAGADSIGHCRWCGKQADGKDTRDDTFHKGIPVDWSLVKRYAP